MSRKDKRPTRGSTRNLGPCWYPTCAAPPHWKLTCPGGLRRIGSATFFSCPMHLDEIESKIRHRAPFIERAENPLQPKSNPTP